MHSAQSIHAGFLYLRVKNVFHVYAFILTAFSEKISDNLLTLVL